MNYFLFLEKEPRSCGLVWSCEREGGATISGTEHTSALQFDHFESARQSFNLNLQHVVYPVGSVSLRGRRVCGREGTFVRSTKNSASPAGLVRAAPQPSIRPPSQHPDQRHRRRQHGSLINSLSACTSLWIPGSRCLLEREARLLLPPGAPHPYLSRTRPRGTTLIWATSVSRQVS